MPELEAVPDYYGSIQLSDEEVAQLTARIFPPEWLKAEVERLLDNLMPWLRSNTDNLDMAVDLEAIKEDASPIIRAFLRQKIDSLPDCPPGQVPDLSSVYRGVLPECLPGGPIRNAIEEQALNEAMKFVDVNISLAPDTIDLVDEAKSSGETREQFLSNFDGLRRAAKDVTRIPQAAFYGGMAAVLGLIMALNMPNWRRALRWMGGTMFFSGLILAVTFAILASMVPGQVADAVSENATDLPTAASTLLGNMASSGTKDLAMGFILPSAIIAGLGLVCFLVSFVNARRNGDQA
jgi:hypothetical protein